MPTFSERLKRLRKSRQLSQMELGNAIGVSKSTISMYENGNRFPDPDILEKIASFFSVDMNYLHGMDNAQSGYYHDAETAALAQELKDNPEYRALLDASRGLKPESIKEIMKFIKYQRAKEEPWRNDD